MDETIFALSDRLKELRNRKTDAKKLVDNLADQVDEAESALIAAMVDADVPSFKRGDSGFSLVVQNFHSVEQERKDDLYVELKRRGYESLFTINSRTLSKVLGEMVENNDGEIPDWLDGMIGLFEKASIRITKA